MIISYTGLELPEGKVKYDDPILNSLAEKDQPKKVSPTFFEFIKEEFSRSFAIAVPKMNILDLLILDMEKIETRLTRITDDKEIKLLQKCMGFLEKEILKILSPISLKPTVQLKENEDINAIIQLAMKKANYMFFYTSHPRETHSWLIPIGTDIITCAGKIHSDLARGFIKGDVVSYQDYLHHHNFNDCKTKGIAKTVEKNYIVQPNEVIEIRFNV